jgi:hypothetical protein
MRKLKEWLYQYHIHFNNLPREYRQPGLRCPRSIAFGFMKEFIKDQFQKFIDSQEPGTAATVIPIILEKLDAIQNGEISVNHYYHNQDGEFLIIFGEGPAFPDEWITLAKQFEMAEKKNANIA